VSPPDDHAARVDEVLYALQERAKELSCLYRIEEILGAHDRPIEDVFRAVVDAIPPGLQHSAVCHAKVVYRRLIVRPEGRLFFVNAQYVSEQIKALIAQYQPRVVAVDMSRVPDIEYSALLALTEGEKRITEGGVVAWLVGLNPGVLEVVRGSGLAERLGGERMLFNARVAIERYQALQAAVGGTLPLAAS